MLSTTRAVGAVESPATDIAHTPSTAASCGVLICQSSHPTLTSSCSMINVHQNSSYTLAVKWNLSLKHHTNLDQAPAFASILHASVCSFIPYQNFLPHVPFACASYSIRAEHQRCYNSNTEWHAVHICIPQLHYIIRFPPLLNR